MNTVALGAFLSFVNVVLWLVLFFAAYMQAPLPARLAILSLPAASAVVLLEIFHGLYEPSAWGVVVSLALIGLGLWLCRHRRRHVARLSRLHKWI